MSDRFSKTMETGHKQVDRNNFEEAALSFSQAIQINPNSFEAYKWYGRALSEVGDNREALESYRSAIDISDVDAEIYN